MADSAITITSLTAVGGTKSVILQIGSNIGSCLPYLGLERYEIWEATVNNVASATKVGEADGLSYTRTGLADAATRYYWARPRDLSGNLGDFFPAGPGGRAATTFDPGLDDDDVADIIKTDKTVVGIKTDINDRFADSQIEFRVMETKASGYAASLAIVAKAAGANSILRELGMYLDIPPGNGPGRIRFKTGGQFVIEAADGSRIAAFNSNGTLNVNAIDTHTLTADKLVFKSSGLAIDENYIKDHSATNIVAKYTADPIGVLGSTEGVVQSLPIQTVGQPVLLIGSFTVRPYTIAQGKFINIRFYRGTTMIAEVLQDVGVDVNDTRGYSVNFIDLAPGTALRTYSMRIQGATATGADSSLGSDGNAQCRARFLGAISHIL